MVSRNDAKEIVFDTLQLAGVEFSQIESMTNYVLEMLEVVGRVGDTPDGQLFLTRKQASAYLLERWNLNKTYRRLTELAKTCNGPMLYLNHGRALYSHYHLDQWAKEQIVGPTPIVGLEPAPLDS